MYTHCFAIVTILSFLATEASLMTSHTILRNRISLSGSQTFRHMVSPFASNTVTSPYQTFSMPYAQLLTGEESTTLMKLQRILLTLFAACSLGVSPIWGQTARQVLDATAGKLKNSGGIEAKFEATQFKNTHEAGTASGNIFIQGNKFKIASPSLTTWFDGHTQWTLLRGSDEVNVSTPTAAELQQSNPYTFINLYKRGYNLRLANTNYQGKNCHEVRLIAQNKSNSIQLLILVVDKKTHLPLSIRMKDNHGEWTRIRVNSIRTHRRWSDATFRFNSKQHPGIDVIDLR